MVYEPHPLEGVWIDGAAPRGRKERFERVCDLGRELSRWLDRDLSEELHESIGFVRGETVEITDEDDFEGWIGAEDELLGIYSEYISNLDPPLTIMVGDPDPGDMIVGRREED